MPHLCDEEFFKTEPRNPIAPITNLTLFWGGILNINQILNLNPNGQPIGVVDFSYGGIRIVALNSRLMELFLTEQAALFDELDLPPQLFKDTKELAEISRKHSLREMKKDSENWVYFARWLAIESRTGLAVADFMLKSGLDSTGAVEIGYGIHGDNSGRGFMTRTISCFIEWARLHSKIKRVKAEVRRDNIASSRVLEKNGFRQFVPLVDTVWWEKRV